MKYFSLSRPIVPGGYPKVAKVIEVINFDTPIIQPEIGHTVWGTIEFDTEIPDEDAEAYELIADKKQEFWVVTTSFDDRGHVVSNITDTIWAILKPQNTSYSTGRKDIYVDYFASREDAEQFVLEARSC